MPRMPARAGDSKDPMHPTAATRSLLLALLLALPPAWTPARAEIVQLTWSADGSQTLERSLPVKGFVELCGALLPGQAVQWHYEAGALLDFNIHYHVGKDVVYPAQVKQAARSSGRLNVTLAQDYCWMWVNKGPAPVSLRARLQR
jgi:hypothetical protein